MTRTNLFLHAGATIALVIAAGTAQAHSFAGPAPINRSDESIHQPVVERTDFVLDVAATPRGLQAGEADRLSGWFDGLGLGYGDTITLDDPAGRRGGAANEGVAAVAARYGMLISPDAAPITVGHAAPGTIRVVVSRAVAHVAGCPDWRHANSEYAGGSASNFGCASASNLAAMIANPEDLIEGRQASRVDNGDLSVKAIKAYREAPTTGAKGLKDESTKNSGGSN